MFRWLSVLTVSTSVCACSNTHLITSTPIRCQFVVFYRTFVVICHLAALSKAVYSTFTRAAFLKNIGSVSRQCIGVASATLDLWTKNESLFRVL